ncbi:MAG: AMP-binding protein [Burkholderiaceae bacterium]
MADSEAAANGNVGFRALIDHWAAVQSEAVFVVFDTGLRWTYGQTRSNVLDTARALQDAGVTQGDRVVTWLENGPLALRMWLAVNYIGAVHVPINTAYRGGLLAHALDLAEAAVMVTHAELVERLEAIDRGRLKTVFCMDERAGGVDGLTLRSALALTAARATDPVTPPLPIEAWDPQSYMFTSGTTGPSKAVVSSYRHMFTLGVESYPGTSASDRALVHSPLFHVTGMSAVGWALGKGGSIGIIARFRTSTFWADVKEVGATFVVMMGSIASFLLNEPVTPAEAGTTLTMALIAPMTPDAVALCKRAGIRYYGVFNQTETSVPLRTEFNPETLYTCGRPRPGVQVRLVDGHDIEVPTGQVGELVVRCDAPWTMSSGYYRSEAATAASWRNGWFHTGDGLRMDEAGNYFYVDRVKDSIRRRGENISSYEVEVEVQAHVAVQEAAVVAVPSEFGEDDVMVVVVLQPGHVLDPADLIEFLRQRLAHFMVPRYVRIVDSLPRTPTLKVQKAILRAQGSSESWDREAAGIKVQRDRLGSPQ